LDFNLLSSALRPDAGSVDPFWNSSHSWKIVDWAGGGDPNQLFASIINATGYTTGSFSLSDGTGADLGDVLLNFTVAAVPEPATLAFCSFAIIGAGYLSWRRYQLKNQEYSAEIEVDEIL